MELVDSVIYFDDKKQLYNFPFTIRYNDRDFTIDFLFNEGQYVDQEDMLKDRIDYCSKELFNHFMEYFEYLQEICLDDSIEANNETVNNINGVLKTIVTLYQVFGKIHCNSMVTNRIRDLLDELEEMFLLLEDYYTIERKRELHNWKVSVNNLISRQ